MSVMKGFAEMYDALLSIKALDSPVKLDMRVPCRLTLLLAMAVELGIANPDPGNPFRKIVSEEDQGKLMDFVMEALKKGEMEEFFVKMKKMGQGNA